MKPTRKNTLLTVAVLIAGTFVNMGGGCPPELLDQADALFGTSLAPPLIFTISPGAGSVTGGTTVTIRGANFDPTTGVLFGNQSAENIKWINGNLLEVITPAGSAGTVDLTVISGSEQTTVFPGGFQYIDDTVGLTTTNIASVQPDRAPVLGGTTVTLLGTGFQPGTQVLFGAFLGTDIDVVSENMLHVTAPAQTAGTVDLFVRSPSGETQTVTDGFRYVPLAGADAEIIRQLEQRFPGGPRVVSAVSLGNVGVRVTYSEPVSASALAHANYSIVIPTGGVLLLDPAVTPVFNSDQTVVDLTTLGQGEVTYQLTVSGIHDLAGNPLAAPDILVNPTQTIFNGIAPPVVGDHADFDGDGLADWFEMLGWEVNIEFENGVRAQAYVTSNPFVADTDGDGLSDSEENARSLDPRTDDTDADLVLDGDEIYLYFSDPTDQDTDDDGFSDKTELFFKTSPRLADTDGDQLNDFEELVLRNRNPRRADLPIPQIVIGTTNIEIDERFTYTDEMGVEQSTEISTQSAFTQSETNTFSESNTTSNEATNSFSQQLQIGGEGGLDDGKPGFKIGGQVGIGFGQERGRGYSSAVSSESSTTAQEEYTEALSQALAISERNSVTRSVEAARVTVDLSIVNAGNLAFTIRNLEVSARVKDPNARDRFVPMATLEPQSGNNEYNLGPLDSQRGPFIFENAEIFPSLAQDLLREPRAMIFEIANFDIEDEFGRNFAFTSEEINDVTAAITIDYGNGEVESHRVATASTFSPLGIAQGITMREAMTEIIGLDEATNEDTLPTIGLSTAALLAIGESYGTNVGSNGEQILTRVRDVQTQLDSQSPDARFWVVMSSADIPDNTDFGDLVLRPGDSYLLWYVQDADDDGLYAREEFLAGCSDTEVDTDGDGISDFDEVRTGWFKATSGDTRKVYSHPALADSDLDQVPDDLERRLGMDPRSDDTDGDGLKDNTEVNGYTIVLLDGDNDPLNDLEVDVAPYSDAAIIEPRSGGDGIVTTVANPDSDDVQAIRPGQAASPGAVVVRPGPDGIIDTVPDGDEFVSNEGPAIVATNDNDDAQTQVMAGSDDVQVAPFGSDVDAGDVIIRAGPDGILQTAPVGSEAIRSPHRAMFASDPVQADTDFDGLVDGREEFLGSRPNIDDADTVLDSDFDGLTNQQENEGWIIGGVVGGTHVTSNPNDPDSDNDGLPDVIEWALFTNPNARDTDGDDLNDIIEYDPTDAMDFFSDDRVDAAMTRCADAVGCDFTPAPAPIGTDPVDADTDDDLLNDGAEVEGWRVTVLGQAAIDVVSDPFLPDTDGDQLSDYAEFRGADNNSATPLDATDPTEPDTDNDGVTDKREIDQNGQYAFVSNMRRSGVVPDQLLRARYTRFNATGDCDNSSNEDYVFWFEVTAPNNSGTRCTALVDTNDLRGFLDGFSAYTSCSSSCVQNTGPCDADTCSGGIAIEQHMNIGVDEPISLQGSGYFVKPYNRNAELDMWVAELDGSCGGTVIINPFFGSSFFHENVELDGTVTAISETVVRTNSSGCDFEIDYQVSIVP